MIDRAVLSRNVQAFITENLHKDLTRLVLKGSPFPQIDTKFLVQQIQGKRKAQKKLPTYFSSSKVLYPPRLNLSQSSSEQTALYKSQLVSGERLIDITGGFGVDTLYFSKTVKQVEHCEWNKNLSEMAAHNFKELSPKNNAVFSCGDG